jgi:hypothetical protein
MEILGLNKVTRKLRDLLSNEDYEMWAENGDIYMRCLGDGYVKRFHSSEQVKHHLENYIHARAKAAALLASQGGTRRRNSEMARMVAEYDDAIEAMVLTIKDCYRQGPSWMPEVQAQRAHDVQKRFNYRRRSQTRTDDAYVMDERQYVIPYMGIQRPIYSPTFDYRKRCEEAD